ncbi:MAG: hypothetical protein Q7R67_00560 [bacterium]|nr:hypothetical protein [bacterium]
MKKLTKMIPFALMVMPAVAMAQLTGTQGLVRRAGELVQSLTIVVAGIALLVFFWGLARFIMKAGDETAIEEGRRLMIWGVVALFVMVSVWGIIYFIGHELFPGMGDNYYEGPPVPGFRQ